MCLILAGLFIAPKIYRLNLLTLGDYYRVRYNRAVEIFCSACIVVSYLGWVAAQISALGLIFNVLTDGAVSQEWGMVIGASVVLIYTLFGGMLSVAVLDFIQMVVIAAGLVYIMWIVADLAGGVGTVVDHAEAAGAVPPVCRAGALHRRALRGPAGGGGCQRHHQLAARHAFGHKEANAVFALQPGTRQLARE